MNIENNISNFILVIEIDKFKCCYNYINQAINIDVSKLKSGKGITFNQQIDDNGIKLINISILPILPEGENTITIEEKEILSVKKIYPPFEMKSTNNNQIQKKPSQIKMSIKTQ